MTKIMLCKTGVFFFVFFFFTQKMNTDLEVRSPFPYLYHFFFLVHLMFHCYDNQEKVNFKLLNSKQTKISISICSTILAERNLFTVFIRRKTRVLM